MAPNSTVLRITRYWTPASAPTGESRCQTEDGTVWRIMPSSLGHTVPFATGVMRGYVEGNTIRRTR